jgi:hypothetical protein
MQKKIVPDGFQECSLCVCRWRCFEESVRRMFFSPEMVFYWTACLTIFLLIILCRQFYCVCAHVSGQSPTLTSLQACCTQEFRRKWQERRLKKTPAQSIIHTRLTEPKGHCKLRSWGRAADNQNSHNVTAVLHVLIEGSSAWLGGTISGGSFVLRL